MVPGKATSYADPYTVEPGDRINFKGEPFISIKPDRDLGAIELSLVTDTICSLLNELAAERSGESLLVQNVDTTP